MSFLKCGRWRDILRTSGEPHLGSNLWSTDEKKSSSFLMSFLKCGRWRDILWTSGEPHLGSNLAIYRWKKSSSFLMSFLKVVGEEGFEPPTLWSQTRCATKLRYSPRRFVWFLKLGTSKKLPKLMGWLTRFELATTGITIQGSTNWAIATTNFLYNRLKAIIEIVVGEEGFEPPTLWSQTRCATKLRYSPTSFVSILGIVNQHWKPKLPIFCKERMGWLTRFELATTGITIQGSTNWAIATIISFLPISHLPK